MAYVLSNDKHVVYSARSPVVIKFIVDREAGEIIRFLVSIRPFMRPERFTIASPKSLSVSVISVVVSTGRMLAVDHPFNYTETQPSYLQFMPYHAIPCYV